MKLNPSIWEVYRDHEYKYVCINGMLENELM